MPFRLEDLDLDTLKKLVELKEQNDLLFDLEKKRRKLQRELERVEREISEYVTDHPKAKSLLEVMAEAEGEENNRSSRVRRRPRGWVGRQVEQVFGEAQRPLTPSEIRDRVADRHPEMASKNLYLSIFQHLRRRPEYQQTSDGWILRQQA